MINRGKSSFFASIAVLSVLNQQKCRGGQVKEGQKKRPLSQTEDKGRVFYPEIPNRLRQPTDCGSVEQCS